MYVVQPSSFEIEYPDLFAPLSAAERVSVSFALQNSRLSGREFSRDGVALLIRSVLEQMSDADFIRAAIELADAKPGTGLNSSADTVGVSDELEFEDGDLPLDDADYVAGLERLKLARAAEHSVRELPRR